MAWRRFDSLFARLLLLQALLLLGLLLVFGALVYVERNVAVARLAAQRWAPALHQAAGWRSGPAVPEPVPALQRSSSRPPLAWSSIVSTPRIAALEDELRRLGVPLQDSAVATGLDGAVLWLQVRQPGGAMAWFGVSDAALLPTVPSRLLLAVLLAVLLLAGVSWVFTRRLTRPLEQLRSRMLAQRPGDGAGAAASIASATPEVAAIEAAYADLLQRFERHERERALLLAGVSHDLRSPLARIRMAAGLLPDAPESAPWRDAIVRNTQVADRLIESFLDHVRAGELALDQDADLAALARSAAAATGRGSDLLAVVAPGQLPLQHTHALLLERLLANLLDNAFKHGRPPVLLRVEAQDGCASVEVLDHGPGVPPAQRMSVLQAFARGDAARSTPGAGLGLAIVARVVARMAGTLAFVEREGMQGVRVELPLQR